MGSVHRFVRACAARQLPPGVEWVGPAVRDFAIAASPASSIATRRNHRGGDQSQARTGAEQVGAYEADKAAVDVSRSGPTSSDAVSCPCSPMKRIRSIKWPRSRSLAAVPFAPRHRSRGPRSQSGNHHRGTPAPSRTTLARRRTRAAGTPRRSRRADPIDGHSRVLLLPVDATRNIIRGIPRIFRRGKAGHQFRSQHEVCGTTRSPKGEFSEDAHPIRHTNSVVVAVTIAGAAGCRSENTAPDTAAPAAPPAAGATTVATTTPGALSAPVPGSLPAGATAQMAALGDSIFHGETAGGMCFTCHGADAKEPPSRRRSLPTSGSPATAATRSFSSA